MSGSLAEKLVVGLAGQRLLPAERDWLLLHRPAGVILFARNVSGAAGLAALCAELRAVLPRGAEIVADHEGGPVSALASALGRPCVPWGLGALDDTDLTFAVHRETAAAAAELGLTRLLAPCADVLTEPRNPVIGSRAFGADPLTAARHAAAAAAGLIDGGVGACPKHWPGHGGSAVDTHLEAAAAGAAAAEPFAAAVAAGADALLLGHLPLERGRPPATLDPAAAVAARRLLPAGGLLWADDVTMGALRGPLSAAGASAAGEGLADPAQLPRGWFAAVAAGGCDRLLCRGIPWRAFPPRGSPSSPPAPEEAAETPPCSCGPASARARLSLAARAGRPGPGPLLWLDCTAGDRWGELTPAIWREAGMPPPVLRLAGPRPSPPADAGRFASIVVTSHRPPQFADGMVAGLAADRGYCLAAGHPSLGAELRRSLPPGWTVGEMPDASGEDLAAVAAAW